MLKYILRFLHESFFVKIGKVAEQAVADVRALTPPSNVLLLAAWLAEDSEYRQGLLRARRLRCVGNLTNIPFSPFDIRLPQGHADNNGIHAHRWQGQQSSPPSSPLAYSQYQLPMHSFKHCVGGGAPNLSTSRFVWVLHTMPASCAPCFEQQAVDAVTPQRVHEIRSHSL